MKSTIYFITDCHFAEDTVIDEQKILSLARIIKNDQNDYIYLAVSGDVAHSGLSVEYDLFIKFFKRIKEESQKDIRLVTCPGNHDINFAGEEYTLQSLIEDTKKEKINDAFTNRVSKIASYQSFERNYVKSETVDQFLTVSSFKDDEKEIVFYSLDNVIFSCYGKTNRSDDTKNYAYLSEETLSNIKRKNPNQIVFLLMHFPIDYFPSENAHIFKDKISKNVDIILNGHLHVPEREMIIGKGNTAVIQGDFFSKGKFDESSSFIKINLAEKKYTEFKWENDAYVEQESDYKLELNSSRWNVHNVCFNNDFYSQLTRCEIMDKVFNIEDIFVFPYLSKEKYQNITEKDDSIKDFNNFLLKAKNNSFIYIYGEEGSGKTSLSKYLTLLFFNENYFPVLCEGCNLEKTDYLNKQIKNKIREMYTESAYSKFANDVPFNSKVLIIDNLVPYENDVINEVSKYFKTIIVITRLDKKKLITKPIIINDEEVLEYTIQPMVKTKRKEFTFKIYDSLTKLGEKSSLTKEKFFSSIEKQLDTLAINDVCDPISLAYIEINAFHSTDLFDNTLFSNVNQAKSLLMLDAEIKKKKYECNIDSINRIIGYIAYNMYLLNKSEFSMEEITNAFNIEINEYGEPGIKPYDFSELVLDALIAKQLENRCFTFYNRDIFSYYIALFINIQMGDGNNTGFNNLLKKDIFIPLNFNILMCITSIYKNATIPYTLIDSIYDESKDMPVLDDDNFSISGITKDKREELKSLTHEDIVKINEREDEYEKKKHDSYLKNKDNLYYVDIVPPEVKDINTWLDKLKICCILLKNFSGTIKKGYKEKLIELIISLPNVVLYKFNDYLFKELDNIYAYLKENSTKPEIASTVLAFNDFIISVKRAFILSTYDYGSRSFTDSASKELLKSVINGSGGELKIVQNLMLQSFIINGDSFIHACSSLIENDKYKDNSFIKASAKLIARRYIAENFEDCTRHHKKFVRLVFNSTEDALKYKVLENKKK